MYAYSFDDAYRQSMQLLLQYEKTLDIPREHIRVFSIVLKYVDKLSYKQSFKVTYKIMSKYKIDYEKTQFNKFNTIIQWVD